MNFFIYYKFQSNHCLFFLRLGLILGSKLFIDTNKFEFIKCMEKVMSEIDATESKESDDEDEE